MLPKNRRISRKEFPYILTNGKRFNSPHILLYIAKAKEEKSPSKFSFSVSKKSVAKASGRNKYRRWGYSIISGQKSDIQAGFRCFFSFKKGLKELKYNDVEKEVLELLSSSSVIR